jgi:hypothetical protein
MPGSYASRSRIVIAGLKIVTIERVNSPSDLWGPLPELDPSVVDVRPGACGDGVVAGLAEY